MVLKFTGGGEGDREVREIYCPGQYIFLTALGPRMGALNMALNPVMYLLGGERPGFDPRTTPLKDVLGKKSNPDSNWGFIDHQANTEPLCYAGLLILN